MAVRKILMLKKEEKIWTFLLEDDVIVEIHCSLPDSDQHRQPVLGDIYIGKVKNIAANIGAAFIEIAPGKECYYDLSQAPQAIFTHKIGKKTALYRRRAGRSDQPGSSQDKSADCQQQYQFYRAVCSTDNRKYQDRYFREASPFSSGYVQRKTESSQK